MASVDDRIVAMKFDNTSFEAKIATTMASLDRLKLSLDFTNAKRGMDNLTATSNAFQLNGMASAIDFISGKFTGMGAVAFSVINNVVNRAVDAGIRLGKALSLDQVISGFREYETNMNAIQTVLANTKSDGTALEDVNRALDQLNDYSDKTIYNFGEMARNIGTFTAAGVNLDTSVEAIKGIANLAAISGSNSQQASTAMYQLSQALASGSVKLMDWNSIVNAGMGGEVFQKALFETGKTLGTIKDTPINTTFEEWTKAGNTFRGSLEQGWLTADVLTNTLSGFTGDLTDAQLKAMGYNDAQILQIQEMGKTGQEAATKVKTLTQLISTIKESIGSGWSSTFRILIGDFEEAKELFTSMSNVIGGAFTKAADDRNKMLSSWKALGGRDMLLTGLTDGLTAVWKILTTVKTAFEDVFPPVTVRTLYDLTKRFKDFMAELEPSAGTLVLLRRTFQGVFSILSIGIEIVKGIAGVFVDLFKALTFNEQVNSGLLGFLAGLGTDLLKLKETLVDGGGIARYFDELSTSIVEFFDGLTFDNVVERLSGALTKVKEAILEFFQNDTMAGKTEVVTAAFDRVSERFGFLGTAAQKMVDTFGWVFDRLGATWDWGIEKIGKVMAALSNFTDFLKETVAKIPGMIGEVLGNAEYDQVLDTVNVGLFGGLVLAFRKFTSGGLFGGMTKVTDSISESFGKLGETFGALTGYLTAMQQNVKADTLMKIAKAVGILTASLFVLAMIDSAALAKALAATAIGFGQLVATMAVLQQLSTGLGAAKMALLATGIMLIAGSMILLATAAKIFATMSWEEMGKGILGVAAMLTILAVAIKPISANKGGMISTGAGILLVAVALNILALAVKSFAEMEWEAMAQGLVGVAGGLLIIAGSMQLMPSGMMSKGVGILFLAVALNILALAVKSFAEMNWKDMGRGLAGVAGTLLILAGAMHLMPNGISLAFQGAGLLMIGIGLVAIATAIRMLSGLSLKELAKGIGSIAVVLLVLAGTMHVMKGAILGAVAIGIIAPALILLAKAVKMFAKMSWEEILKGIVGLAASLGVITIAAHLLSGAIPVLIAFGIALALIGAGFALFGLGATLVASAFTLVVSAGTEGIATLVDVITVLIQHIPKLVVAIGEGLIKLVGKLVEALPDIIAGFDDILVAILDTIINAIPKVAEVFTTLVRTLIETVTTLAPEIIAAGFNILIAFLTGIRDNIGEIVTLAAEIITNFLDALAEKVPEIIDSVFNLLMAVIEGVVAKLVDVGQYLLPKGVELLEGLLAGLAEKVGDVITWFQELPGKIVGWIGDLLGTIKDKGVQLLTGLYNGITEKVTTVMNWLLDLPRKLGVWVGSLLSTLKDKGVDLLTGLYDGIKEKVIDIMVWALELPGKIKGWLGDAAKWLINIGKDIIRGLWEGILSMKDWIVDKTKGIAGWLTSPLASALQILSPSKVMAKLGVHVAEGLIVGIDSMKKDVENTSSDLGNKIIDGFDPDGKALGDRASSAIKLALLTMTNQLDNINEFSPTITPVLDLTNVQRGAGQLRDILRTGASSYDQAALLSVSSQPDDISNTSNESFSSGVTEIKFEQTINSPTALSTADIYRQTRNQIAMAKEELAVL